MGGPRSVWEEKPLLIKTTRVSCERSSVSRSEGDVDIVVATTELCGWPKLQQSIGQFTGADKLWISERSERGGASDIG